MTDDHYLAIIREHTTPKELEALLLRYNGHDEREAAEFLGISRRAYRDRCARGIRRIKMHTPANTPK